jgi:hypothetical protein
MGRAGESPAAGRQSSASQHAPSLGRAISPSLVLAARLGAVVLP